MSFSVRVSAVTRFGLGALATALAGAVFAASGLAQNPVTPPAANAPSLLPTSSRLIAGNGTTATFTVGQTCPSGAPNTATDAYGDGCLATDIKLTAARYAIADTAGNVFFTDYTNALVRRVDATTGIVTAVAGGAKSNPAKGAACGTSTSTDLFGDGCLGTQVALGHPVGLAFDTAGNLYFADYYNYQVRELLATGGLIPATGGVIKLIDGGYGGTSASAHGYQANTGSQTSCTGSPSPCILAATQGLLYDPYDITVDGNGDVLIADYNTNAVLAVNTSATTQTVGTISIPSGTVGKIVGALTSGSATCTNSTAAVGCNYGSYVENALANNTNNDDPWTVATDAAGNIFLSEEYNTVVAYVDTAGKIHTYAGIQGTLGKGLANTIRNTNGTFGIGATQGLATDAQGNLYVGDVTNGLVWRVDAATSAAGSTTGHAMYVVGGGGAATTSGGPCTSGSAVLATDTFGDGCSAKQAKFSASGTFGSTSTALGAYGVKTDKYANVYVGDAGNNVIRELATGAQFGLVGANQPTNVLDIHLAAGDTLTQKGLSLMLGTNFKLGTLTCTANNDNTPTNTTNTALAANTSECMLPVTATPTALGVFSDTLTVTSANGTATFPLSGTYAQSPSTRTTVSFAAGTVSCTGTATYPTNTPVTLTAAVIANGPTPPTGTADKVTFYTGTTQIGQPVPVVNTGTSTSPAYTATLIYTPANPGTYPITAVFSGDTYFKTSTSAVNPGFTIATPSYTLVPIAASQPTVTAGQTGLFSFNVNQVVYTGTISFAITGLPANSFATWSPQTITANGCSQTSTVALSILTNAQQTVQPAGILGSTGGRLPMIFGAMILSVMAIFGRRRSRRLSHLALLFAALLASGSTLGCGKAAGTVLQPATPSGTYPLTVTATGSNGTVVTLTSFTLKVN